MGNHAIGQAMGRAAELWWNGRTTPPSSKEALTILDEICTPYRNSDAEFEADDPNKPGYMHPLYDRYTDPNGPLGRLIGIAFNAKPDEMAIERDGECPWADGPETRFDTRYGFY